jgi:N-acetylmuramoyl-L-alanine amidase
MEIVQLQRHISKRSEKIRYIVIHDTGNASAGAGADAHKRYFLTTDRKASADFLVDEKKVIKLNDYYKYFTWHCGDGRGKYGITNSNSVGIEMCINIDGNYEKTVNDTINLTYKLMKELKIDLDHVVRHYDASRKHCPNSMMANNWARWADFKKALAIFAEKKEAPDVVLVEYNGNKSFIETIKKDNYNYVKIRDIAKLLNKKVSYDKEKITLQD